MYPDIATDKVRLRALEPTDAELLYLWENDRDLWRVSSTTAPLSRHAILRFIEEQQYDIYATRQMRLVIESENITVGTIDIFDFDPQNQRFGIGIMVYASEHRRQGYARAAIEAIKEYGREVLGVKQIWATVGEDNAPSKALFENCGFTPSERRRAWIRRGNEFIDELLYQCIF